MRPVFAFSHFALAAIFTTACPTRSHRIHAKRRNTVEATTQAASTSRPLCHRSGDRLPL